MTIGGASTHVLIDTPRSEITDLRASVLNFEALTARADLLGNLMSSLHVRENIGRLAGIDPLRIAVTVPITAQVPRFITEPGSEQRVTSLLSSTDHYRLDVAANPSVPVLDIYAQAPSAAAAGRLAGSAVEGLRDYLNTLAAQQQIPPSKQVRLLEYGTTPGGVINGGVQIEIVVLTFLTVFAISCGMVVVLARVRQGWALAPSPPAPQSGP